MHARVAAARRMASSVTASVWPGYPKSASWASDYHPRHVKSWGWTPQKPEKRARKGTRQPSSTG